MMGGNRLGEAPRATSPPSRLFATLGGELDRVACLGHPRPGDRKVNAPPAEETFEDIQTTEEARTGADRRETPYRWTELA